MVNHSYKKILMADDDPIIQKITSKMLLKMGVGADFASNGQEVLDAMFKCPYEVVLMDIQMPDMDGIEATKRIREQWHREPKVIIISDCDPNIYKEICYKAGANHFLAKPVKIDELKAAIESN
jgi:CheY-like chemotaxis protein